MTTFELGINTCFAVKRWPRPDEWAELVAGTLGLSVVQHSLDLVDLEGEAGPGAPAGDVVAATRGNGIAVQSTFTGLAAYSSNLLLHPDYAARRRAESWWHRVIDFTSAVGATATGGHVGAYCVADWRDRDRRTALLRELQLSLGRITAAAHRAGLTEFYVENLAVAREPSTMASVDKLLTCGDADHVPVTLCLDVGHQCVAGTSGPDRDPYAWLRRYGAHCSVVQIQQSDADADHHWPFTAEMNRRGRIDAYRVLDALREAGAEHVTLLLEVIPPFEADDDAVVCDLVASVDYWRAALAG